MEGMCVWRACVEEGMCVGCVWRLCGDCVLRACVKGVCGGCVWRLCGDCVLRACVEGVCGFCCSGGDWILMLAVV